MNPSGERPELSRQIQGRLRQGRDLSILLIVKSLLGFSVGMVLFKHQKGPSFESDFDHQDFFGAAELDVPSLSTYAFEVSVLRSDLNRIFIGFYSPQSQ